MIWGIFFIDSKLPHLRQTQESFNLWYLGKKNRLKYSLKIGSITVKEFDEVKLLGISIDKALNFKKQIENLCCTAQYKLHALKRIRKYLTSDKPKLLGNAFIDIQLNYVPLIWMFCHKTTYLKMQKVYHDSKSHLSVWHF